MANRDIEDWVLSSYHLCGLFLPLSIALEHSSTSSITHASKSPWMKEENQKRRQRLSSPYPEEKIWPSYQELSIIFIFNHSYPLCMTTHCKNTQSVITTLYGFKVLIGGLREQITKDILFSGMEWQDWMIPLMDVNGSKDRKQNYNIVSKTQTMAFNHYTLININTGIFKFKGTANAKPVKANFNCQFCHIVTAEGFFLDTKSVKIRCTVTSCCTLWFLSRLLPTKSGR